MAIMEVGVDSVTIKKGEMEMNERMQARAIRPRDGAPRAPSPYSPGATSFPRKREPTGWCLAYAKAGTYWLRLAYAKAGTYPNTARPDRSTLSRRVCGVLSPYRSPLHNPRISAIGSSAPPEQSHGPPKSSDDGLLLPCPPPI